jgi:hypothetical protein
MYTYIRVYIRVYIYISCPSYRFIVSLAWSRTSMPFSGNQVQMLRVVKKRVSGEGGSYRYLGFWETANGDMS